MIYPYSSFYPHSTSRSHLPLSAEMFSILKGIFECAPKSCKSFEGEKEVNLNVFIADVKMNDCLPIVCGENQCHDLLQALHRVSDSLVTTGNDHGLNAWVTWSDLIIHLESAAQPSTVSISNMNAIKEKQMRAIDDLKERKKANLLNQMQKKWGGSTKEEYLEFLERVLPDYARENNNASSTVLSQGGGGAVSSNQTARGADREGAERRHGNLQSENSDQIIVKECKEDKKVSTNDKGSEYFRRIQEQLSKLDLSSTQRSSRLGVSGRIEDQMARTAEERRQAEQEIARLEAECSLDDSEGRREERQEGLVAMRKQPLSEKEEAAVEHSLAGPHDHSVLVDKFNQDITRLKMSCLLPGRSTCMYVFLFARDCDANVSGTGTWLNDEVVNFYMNMLQERDKALCALPGSSRKPSHFFNSFFVSKLLERDEYTYRNVKRQVNLLTWVIPLL